MKHRLLLLIAFIGSIVGLADVASTPGTTLLRPAHVIELQADFPTSEVHD